MNESSPSSSDRPGATGDPWERHASWWQEHFTASADPEYEEQILPLAVECTRGAERVLDAGCGEGQVARCIAQQGASVVGVDPAWAQVDVARRRAGGPRYLRADLTRLPLASASFDAVVVCLVLEHVDDLEGAVGEVARVCAPGGRLVLFLNHPLLQTPGAAWVIDHTVEPPERSWRVGPYLTETSFEDEVARGVRIRFVHRPLHRYLNTVLAAGFELASILEPPPPPGFLALAPEYAEQSSIPRLLVVRANRR